MRLSNRAVSRGSAKTRLVKISDTNLYQMSTIELNVGASTITQERMSINLQRWAKGKFELHKAKEDREAMLEALLNGATVEDGPHHIWIERRFYRNGKVSKILQIT